MKLGDFKSLLLENSERSFKIVLPSGELIPQCFHITEVGHVHKKFLDCGGTYREIETCQLQVWIGPDEDHRLAAKKMLGIFAKAAAFLRDDLTLEFEYEAEQISQYTVAVCAINDESVVLTLAAKHTDCLAKEVCGVAPKTGSSGPDCGCGPGCC